MKSFALCLTLVSMTSALGACSPKPATPPPVAAPLSVAVSATTDASTTKTAKGVGTITAIDAAAGTVTVNHKDIPEIGWPGMEMPFKAAPDVLKGAKVGDQIDFDVKVTDGGSEITALTAK